MVNYTKKGLILSNKISKSFCNPPEHCFCNVSKILDICCLFVENESYIFSKKKINFLVFLGHFLLFLISIYSLLKSKLFGIRNAHYMIDVGNYDHRSEPILDILNPKESINFLHINNIKFSLKNFYKKNNPFFFESFFIILSIFFRKEKDNLKINFNVFSDDEKKFVQQLIDWYEIESRESFRKIKIISWILKVLKIEKFLMLDDSRNTSELILASNHCNINTYGYVHGRFNEFHVGLFHYPYDYYFVWSDYFKKLILRYNNKYEQSKVIVVNHPKINHEFILNKRDKTKNILLLGETNEFYFEILPMLKKLINNDKIKLIYRGKPANTDKNINTFLKNNDIEIYNDGTFFDTLISKNINVVIGTCSTCLIESWILRVPSILLKTSYEYPEHMIRDKLSLVCESSKDIIESINNAVSLNDNEVEKFYNRSWNKKYVFDIKKMKKYLFN